MVAIVIAPLVTSALHLPAASTMRLKSVPPVDDFTARDINLEAVGCRRDMRS